MHVLTNIIETRYLFLFPQRRIYRTFEIRLLNDPLAYPLQLEFESIVGEKHDLRGFPSFLLQLSTTMHNEIRFYGWNFISSKERKKRRDIIVDEMILLVDHVIGLFLDTYSEIDLTLLLPSASTIYHYLRLHANLISRASLSMLTDR